MQKPLILAIAALLLIGALGAGAFFFLNKSSENKKTNTGSSMNNSETTSSRSSIESLLGKGRNVTCSVNYEQGSGTVYVADKKMYGEFDTESAGQTYKGYVLQDGTYSYTWSSQNSQGVKFKTDAAEQPSSEDQKSGVDVKQEADVSCQSWAVDNSKFTPPSNITFTDLTSTLNQVQDQTDSVKEQQKAACEKITDPTAKAYCLDNI